MADNVKISELTELTSGSLRDATIFPVVDGGTTQKTTLTSLQSYLTDDLATDAELTSQISTVNSTINALDTSDISENPSNLYYTNARVTEHVIDLGMITSSQQVEATQIQNLNTAVLSALGGSDVLSGSISSSTINNFDSDVSASVAAAGFGAGDGGGGASTWGELSGIPSGLVSESAQTIEHINTIGVFSGSTDFTTAVSESAAASGFSAADGGGGGGSTDYISNVTFSNTTLTFTGQGSAFNNTVDLSDAGLVTATGYLIDSSSFASRIDTVSSSIGGGGGGDVTIPNGTVSSSAQTIQNLGGTNIVSSSGQIVTANTDLTGLTIDDIGNGSVNKYYANSLVLPYLNQLQVLSGSSGGGGFSISGTDIISSSQQISDLNFILQSALDASASALQANIDGIQGVNLVDENDFTATQKFREVQVTGSVLLTNGSFSGSGAQLFGIPSSAIIGTVAVEASSLSDGDNSITANSVVGITINTPTGSILANGDIVIQSGSLISGSGAGLFNIPGSAIEGGVDGQKIASGSFSASIEDGTGNFIVGPPAIFNSTISASGAITAESISVGTSGTPTIYSDNNLNLSASNAVVITDSPFRLTPFDNDVTASFSVSNGDILYSLDSHDFLGYKSGSWVSLTGGGDIGTNFGGTGIISSSAGISNLAAGIVSSSAQITPTTTLDGHVLIAGPTGDITSSADLTFNNTTNTLTVDDIVVSNITYTGALSGNADSTGSFGRLEGDTLILNNAIQFPTSDGTSANQVLKTDGAGNIDFATVESLITTEDITTTGTITIGTGSVIGTGSISLDDNLTVGGTINTHTITTTTTNIESVAMEFRTEGELLLSSSNELGVKIDDILQLTPRTTTPANPQSGSIISSGSGNTIKPYFWDGNQWNALY